MNKKIILIVLLLIIILSSGLFLKQNTKQPTIQSFKETASKEELPTKYQNDFSSVENPATSVPVLMYHYFYDETKEEPQNGNFYSIQKFEQQLAHFKEEGYITLTMEELYDWLEGKIEVPEKSVVITMDDGYSFTYDYALPLLEKYNYVGISFEITGDRDESEYASRLSHINLELESHTHRMHQGTCPGATPIQYGAIQCEDFNEAVQDMETSSTILNQAIAMAYPFGGYGGQAKDVLKQAGYKLAFTTQYGVVKRGMDYLELPRVRMSSSSFFE